MRSLRKGLGTGRGRPSGLNSDSGIRWVTVTPPPIRLFKEEIMGGHRVLSTVVIKVQLVMLMESEQERRRHWAHK